MPKFTVRLERTRFESVEVEVEAKNKADAEQIALARKIPEDKWELGNDRESPDVLEVTRTADEDEDEDDTEWVVIDQHGNYVKHAITGTWYDRDEAWAFAKEIDGQVQKYPGDYR